MKYKKITLFVATSILFLNSGSVSAAIVTPTVTSKAAVVADLNTGQVIADKNGSQRLPIASISKLLVIYMTEQAIKDKKISRNQTVTIPHNISVFSKDTSVVNIPLRESFKTYTVNDLEKAALLPSSNSAAMALANLVAGNQDNYYKKAEQLLNTWNIKNTTIYSSSGLRDGDLGAFNNKSVDDKMENTLSAREVAIIAKKIINEFPNILNITSLEKTSFPTETGSSQEIKSTDLLLNNKSYKFTGLKTGVTPNNGGNFVGLTKLNNEPIITVVLNSGAQNPDEVKFSDTIKLLDEVSKTTKVQSISDKKTLNKIDAKTKNGIIDINTIGKNQIFVPKSKKVKLNSKINYKKIDLPIKKDQTVAKRMLEVNNDRVNDYLQAQPTINYSSSKDIKKANIFVIGFRHFMSIFK